MSNSTVDMPEKNIDLVRWSILEQAAMLVSVSFNFSSLRSTKTCGDQNKQINTHGCGPLILNTTHRGNRSRARPTLLRHLPYCTDPRYIISQPRSELACPLPCLQVSAQDARQPAQNGSSRLPHVGDALLRPTQLSHSTAIIQRHVSSPTAKHQPP